MAHTDSWAPLYVYRSNHQPPLMLSSLFPLPCLSTIAKISPTFLTLHTHAHTLSLPTHTCNPHHSQRNQKQTTLHPVTLPYWPWEQCCSVCREWRKRSARWSPPLSSLSLLCSPFLYTLLLCHLIFNMQNFSFHFSSPAVLSFCPWRLQRKVQTENTREFRRKSIKEKAVHLSSLLSGNNIIPPQVTMILCDVACFLIYSAARVQFIKFSMHIVQFLGIVI